MEKQQKPTDLQEVAGKFNDVFQQLGWTVATAESCTSGLVASVITSVSGASKFFQGGVVAYSNEIKQHILGVNATTLKQYGAVSEETVTEMVRGAQTVLRARCAVATSGIAGPTGGTPDKPVGTIWMAAAIDEHIMTHKLTGDLGRVRNVERTVQTVLSLLLDMALKYEKAAL